jgi:hypothetical protein
MIKHIVLWKLKEISTEGTKDETSVLLKNKLLSLKNIIPEIITIEVGINTPEVQGNFDIVLMVEFANLQDLDVYQNHPAHLKVVEFVKLVREERVAIDFVK